MTDIKISLAAARVNAEMTQDDVAKALKVSKTTVTNWETGKTAVSYPVLMALSELYSFPADNIFLPVKTN